MQCKDTNNLKSKSTFFLTKTLCYNFWICTDSEYKLWKHELFSSNIICLHTDQHFDMWHSGSTCVNNTTNDG